MENNIVETIKKLRSNAYDLVEIIDFGILPIVKHDDEEEYEISFDKFNKLVAELLEVKERLNKDFSELRRKVK